MLNHPLKEALKKNWGEKADAMDCYCEVKFIDPSGDWSCYVYALDPYDEDTIKCIASYGSNCEAFDWSLNELMEQFNELGEYVQVDHEFRRIKASVLYKKLGGI